MLWIICINVCKESKGKHSEIFEVILVDDGSMDGSAEICDAFCREDKRFRVIHKKMKV